MLVRRCRRHEPTGVRQGVLAAIIGIRARMAVAFEATSRSFAGPRAIGKAVQWRDDNDNCKQRYGDVNATSHPFNVNIANLERARALFK